MCGRDLRIPLSCIGGGEQEIVGLIWHFYSNDNVQIFGLEEPEMHLHPKLCKELFQILKQERESKQILLVTHSEIFMDQDEIKNNWIVKKEDGKTRVENVTKDEQLKEILNQVGAEPKDRLYPNKILLVAGETEKVVLPIWAKKIGVDFSQVLVDPLDGEWDKRKVRVIQEYTKTTQTRVFLMVDDHGKDLVERAITQDLESECCLVLQGTIEDCYPIKIVKTDFKDVFNLDPIAVDINPEKPRIEEIKRIFRQNKRTFSNERTWKCAMGSEVAERMNTENIPVEVRTFLEKVAE